MNTIDSGNVICITTAELTDYCISQFGCQYSAFIQFNTTIYNENSTVSDFYGTFL